MFFFASVQRQSRLIESAIGPCTYCSSGKGGNTSSVNVIEKTSKWFFFGFIPTKESVDRLAVCTLCGRGIKEVHYNCRTAAVANTY
mmetsp:Transcript_14737/g.16883  ORF Transcript_14737/g.16883 Transcript_14737/m.16883 type:complete len:86 (-) Transcript_14737:212-469(-)